MSGPGLRIIHYVPLLDPRLGGPPAVALRVCRALAHRGHDMVLCGGRTLDDTGHDEFTAAQASAQLRVHRFAYDGQWRSLLSRSGPTPQLAARGEFDLLHLDGVWEPANNIQGNLMIRPLFGFKKAVGIEDAIFKGIKVYPNPKNGVFAIAGQFEKAVILDILGNTILEINGGQIETEIKLSDRKHGLYLLKVLKQGRNKTFKIIVN